MNDRTRLTVDGIATDAALRQIREAAREAIADEFPGLDPEELHIEKVTLNERRLHVRAANSPGPLSGTSLEEIEQEVEERAKELEAGKSYTAEEGGEELGFEEADAEVENGEALDRLLYDEEDYLIELMGSDEEASEHPDRGGEP